MSNYGDGNAFHNRPLACECEHAAHTEPKQCTPSGKPGHPYGQRITTFKFVITAYGVFKVCGECYGDCYGSKPL